MADAAESSSEQVDQILAGCRLIGIANTYSELIDLLRKRKDELGVTMECLDSVSGNQTGYTAKLLAPVPIRRLGRVSLGPILQSLGLQLLVAEDLSALKRIESQLTKRDGRGRDASHKMLATRKRGRKRWKFPKGPEFARLMNSRRILKLTKKERSRIARTAALARWQLNPRTGAGGCSGIVR